MSLETSWGAAGARRGSTAYLVLPGSNRFGFVQKRAPGWRFRWCGREDSNFHGVSSTATSTLRVYQFRHDRISSIPLLEWRACLANARYHIKLDGPAYGHRSGGNRVAPERPAGAL